MIELKVTNHRSEYELQNIINIFLPYIKQIQVGDIMPAFLLQCTEDKGRCMATLQRDNETIASCVKQVNTTGMEKNEADREIRLGLKYAAYNVLSQTVGKTMPWGILTGIRPTKIVHDLSKRGYSDLEISTILENQYCIAKEKIKLLIQVATKERGILKNNKPQEINLYIGIPFCPTRCLYCSFTSHSLDEKGHLVESYVDALCEEIEYVGKEKAKDPIRSIYIGGGTPTSLTAKQLTKLLQKVTKTFDIDAIEEFTVEAGRPDTITREKLSVLKKYGVNRISINPQTMNQKTLNTIGRAHTVDDIERVFKIAREEGHDNINMDLIIGLPEETPEDVIYTMNRIQKLRPESITVHTMAIKRASRLRQKQDDYKMTKTADIEKMLKITAQSANNMKMEPYYMYRQKNMVGNFENVGFAVLGKECIYNVEIMEEKESIIAMGAGAVTKVVHDAGRRIERVPNIKNVEQYIDRVDQMIERKKEAFTKYE